MLLIEALSHKCSSPITVKNLSGRPRQFRWHDEQIQIRTLPSPEWRRQSYIPTHWLEKGIVDDDEVLGKE